MVGTAHQNKGLTGGMVARDMFQQWDMFGIPSRVSSDRGSHFANAWWQTLCAAHGVQVAYGHAYHHQAQGRVENAGQQVKLKLAKMNAEGGTPWPELLPRVLRQIHDLPGPTGLSPYEIVFGRQRGMAGLPYRPVWEAEDATQFLKRMKELDAQVAESLNELQGKRALQPWHSPTACDEAPTRSHCATRPQAPPTSALQSAGPSASIRWLAPVPVPGWLTLPVSSQELPDLDRPVRCHWLPELSSWSAHGRHPLDFQDDATVLGLVRTLASLARLVQSAG